MYLFSHVNMYLLIHLFIALPMVFATLSLPMDSAWYILILKHGKAICIDPLKFM